MYDEDFKQADRLKDDGAISVQRDVGSLHHLVVECDNQTMRMSYYNAARIFGCLAVMLGIRLSRKIEKAIKL